VGNVRMLAEPVSRELAACRIAVEALLDREQ
jgi:hypothetical protein